MSGMVIGLFVACMGFAVVASVLRRPKPEPGELMRLRESVALAVIGVVVPVFCLAAGLWLVNRGGTQATELFLFVSAGMLLGCVSLLWYFVRCTIVTDERVIAVGPLGGRITLRWIEIARLKLENGRLVLLDFSGRQCAVAGSKKQMAAFAAIAKKHLRPELRESIGQLIDG